MARLSPFHLLLCFLPISFCSSSQVFIVYMGRNTSESTEEVLRSNFQMLASVHGGSIEKATKSLVYSYSSGFRGFAATLTQEQVRAMADMPGVVSVFPNLRRQLHTTHSWDFMGLTIDESVETPGFSPRNQENVIIGFIDTGIWPESPSFHDDQMAPVPSKWKGVCQTGEAFTAANCNRKIIGARYYSNAYLAEEKAGGIPIDRAESVDYKSPRDGSGHGSHTASIAAGRFVKNMQYNGLAAGGGRGGAPMARISIYKTCWSSGCYDADILAAFNDAIKDGVDVLSLSLGSDSHQGDYFSDVISIGSFHAVSHGIVVVASAGNAGTIGSATNVAPWMLTVAAGSTDRDFTSVIALGNGAKFKGASLSTIKMNRPARIISASEANAGYFTSYQSSYCLDSSLNRTKARGKILVCRHAGLSSESKVGKSKVVKMAGGIGMILIDKRNEDVAVPFAIPASAVGRRAGGRILSYVNRTRKPISLISPAKTLMGCRPAPQVAAFSSKGPNSLTPDILKPDVAAPGLNILAAWSPAVNKRNFNIASGTSMACPHVTGIVALIKAANPSWSPSAIKSAIMTTATYLDKRGNAMVADPDGRVANPFDYGSGFLNPTSVLGPGLVYDAKPSDYKDFLCSIGHSHRTLRLIVGDKSSCTRPPKAPSNLNYPSFTVSDLKGVSTISRTVTNLRDAQGVYRAIITPPPGINVTVVPDILKFSKYGQRLSFAVTFTVVTPPEGYVFGSLSWEGGRFQVRSPLVVRVASSHIVSLYDGS